MLPAAALHVDPAHAAARPRRVARARAQPHTWAFVAVNTLLLLPATVGWASGAQQPGPLPYVVLLALVCSLPLLLPLAWRGRAVLLHIFLAYYFLSFGFGDVVALLTDAVQPPRDSLVTAGEWAILLGAVCAIASYLGIQALFPVRAVGLLRQDWRPESIAAMGWLCWLAGTYATIVILWGVGQSLFGDWLGLVVLARMLGLMGVMLIAYLCFTAGGRTAWLSLAVIIVADFVLGFLSDSKEAAFRAQLLAVLTYVLVRGRLPWLAIGAGVLLAGLTFSTFAAYRHHLSVGDLSRIEALASVQDDIGGIANTQTPLDERMRAGLDYLASRSNLKGVIETVVLHTGVDVPFQEGATFGSLAYVFVPRALVPDKPNTLTGREFNLAFGISESTEVYISNTMLGEFYWNFGWTGLVLGMLGTGVFMGVLNRVLDFEVRTNLPRLLVLMLTIYVVVLRFEANVAQAYTLWLRTMLLFMLLHMLMPKRAQVAAP